MVSCLHAAIWTPAGGQQGDNKSKKRATEGQEEEKTKDKKRTPGGQGLEAGWQPRPSWCQQEDNRRTRRRQEERQKNDMN